MALNQKLVKEKLDEWAKLRTKLDKAAAQKNKELEPFIREHNERVAPIIEKYDAKFNPLVDKTNALAKEIEAILLGNTDKEGNPKPLSLNSVLATASVSKTEGARTIAVQKFFAFVKNKTGAFWDCITVQIGKADKLIGKSEVDKISDKKKTYSVHISLKK